MIAAISLIAPSIIGIKIIDTLIGEDKKSMVYDFCILILLSIMINNAFSYVFFHIESDIFYYLNQLPIYAGKYIFVSCIVNIVLAIIITIIKKNTTITLEVLDEKGKKRKKNKSK